MTMSAAAAVPPEPELDGVEPCGHNDHMAPRTIGVRELKTRLGAYLRQVRAGRTFIVTDRGEPIAELRPLPAQAALPARLAALASTGTLTLPAASV